MAEVNAAELYDVFRLSYSMVLQERRHAEAYLGSVARKPGFLPALLRISTEVQADANIRQAAAIQLKNQVRSTWDVSDPSSCWPPDSERSFIRQSLLDSIVVAFALQGVRAQLVETCRLISLVDFPEKWPGLLEQILVGLRSDDTVHVHAALLALRKLFKQLQMRTAARRTELDSLCAQTLPVLRVIGPTLRNAAAQSGHHCLQALEMLRILLKCFYSACYWSMGDAARQEVLAFLELCLSVEELSTSSACASRSQFEVEALLKCRKWIFHIFFRFLLKHCLMRDGSKRTPDGPEGFAAALTQKSGVPITEACVREVCCWQQGASATPRSHNLAFLCLAEASCRSVLYAALRPSMQQLLECGIFPLLRFNERDLQLWRSDPEEFIREFSGDRDAYDSTTVAATDLIDRLLQYRQEEVFSPLLQFCQQHIEAHARSPEDLELSSNKYGALELLRACKDELLRLDPGKKKKKKDKSADSKSGAVSVEDFIMKWVKPDLSSPVAFLRFGACRFIEQFVESVQFKTKGSLEECGWGCIQLMGDQELPVRVQASSTLRGFTQCRTLLHRHLNDLVSRLLRTLAEIQSEDVAETLQMLVREFPEDIVPFAAQFVEQLAAQFSQSAAAVDDDDCAAGAAMGTMEAILSILHSCAGCELSQRATTFAQLTMVLLPLLQHLLQADAVGFLEEALEMLQYLTTNGPTPLPSPLWRLFVQLYQAVCGTAMLPSVQPEIKPWAIDCLQVMLPSIENFIVKGPPEVFMAGKLPEINVAYPELLFHMFREVLVLKQDEESAPAAEIPAIFFSGIPQHHTESWLMRYTTELWKRLQWATPKGMLKRSILRSFGVMLWYHVNGFLKCCEELGCSAQLFEIWLCSVDTIESLKEKKAFVLGLIQVFQLASSNGLPVSIAPGLPHVIRQLADQTSKISRLRLKEVHESADADENDGSDSAEEGDLDTCYRRSAMFECGIAFQSLDELQILQQALHQASPSMVQQMRSWLGEEGLSQWSNELQSAQKE